MGLAQTIFNSIKQNYFSVWDIISLIEKKTNNDLFDIGLFLGHINIEEHIIIYHRDRFYNLHEIDLNYNRNPLGEIIDCLMNIMPFDSDEEQQEGRVKVRSKADKLFFSKQDIYNFKPIMDLDFIEKPIPQVIEAESIQEAEPKDKYKFLLYKQHLFSIDECACIISDYDPLEIQKYPHNDIDEIAPDYSRAYSFIRSATEADKLNIFNYKIYADEFREYLASENIIITGFNDHLKTVNIDQSIDNQNPIIDQLKIENEELQQKLKSNEDEYINLAIDLKATENTLHRIVAENEKLKAELVEKEQKIKELNSIKGMHPSINPKHNKHAPELLIAIEAWEERYLKNQYPHQEHTPAITQILKNKDITQTNLVKRICAITNPKK